MQGQSFHFSAEFVVESNKNQDFEIYRCSDFDGREIFTQNLFGWLDLHTLEPSLSKRYSWALQQYNLIFLLHYVREKIKSAWRFKYDKQI